MEDWWAGIESDVLACLADGAAGSPAQIGGRLGMSPAAVTSVLAMLALEGKVLIARVELASAAESSSAALSHGRVSGVAQDVA